MTAGSGGASGVYRALIGDLDPDEHRLLLRMLTGDETREAEWDWGSWAHRGQQPPETCENGAPWRTWVLMAGRGFGKTLAGAKWLTAQIAAQAWGTGTGTCPHSEPLQIALVGATLDEARRIMVEGRSGLLEVADAWVADWQPSLRRLRFRTGAVATLFSGASPEQLRGPEHHLAWCDELAKWEKPRETWDMLHFGLRLGAWPRALITTTPRPGPVLRAIIAEPDTAQSGGPTAANPHNPPAWIESTHRLYAGTRLGRQELDGELLTDAAGALWTVELLERCRILPGTGRGTTAEGGGGGGSELGTVPPPSALRAATSPSRGGSTHPFTKLVIAVDPPAGDGTCGIVACAKDTEGRAHILADHSVTAQSPEGWARAVANAVRVWGAEGQAAKGTGTSTCPHSFACPHSGVLVVAEQNQGGKMVKSVLHTADPSLRVKLVTAHVGKAERAAPVAMLFEAGRVVLHGRFPALEAEMLGMIAGGEYEGPGVSPDRADAMVWGLTELMLGPEQAPPRVRAL